MRNDAVERPPRWQNETTEPKKLSLNHSLALILTDKNALAEVTSCTRRVNAFPPAKMVLYPLNQ
jgi:hypothetical protein